MSQSNPAVAKKIAEAVIAFETRRTGHTPASVTVVLSQDTLVVTLHGALSPAEQALAASPAGAAQMQDYHRQLFNSSFDSLRQEIKRIIGVDVCHADVDAETGTGAVVKAFASGTVVQVFLLAGSVPTDTWSGKASAPVE